MVLLSARDVRNITENNIKVSIIDHIIARILDAAKNGQYGVRIKFDRTDIDTEDIKNIFQSKGYNIEIEVKEYVGSLKKFTEVRVNWHE